MRELFTMLDVAGTNISVEIILSCFTALIVSNLSADRKGYSEKSFNHFSLWVISTLIYYIVGILYYVGERFVTDSTLLIILTVVDTVYSCLTYLAFANWCLTVVSEHKTITKSEKLSVLLAVPILFISWITIFTLLGKEELTLLSITVSMIPLFVIVLTKIPKSDRGTKTLLLVFMIIYSLVEIQTYWKYIPGDVVNAFFIILIYLRYWQNRKHVMLEAQKELAVKQAELSNARIDIAISQIGPHFLYNTLNTISALCEDNPETAADVTDNLADYLRGNLDSVSGGTLVTLEKEIEHTKFYADIEKVRFGESVNIVFDIQDRDFSLPPLTIQPLVENAIKHGIRKKHEPGTVRISTFSGDGGHYIMVEDDGAGFDTKVKKVDGKKHLGVSNVAQRLEYLCGGRLTIESQIDIGTKATIFIPYSYSPRIGFEN